MRHWIASGRSAMVSSGEGNTASGFSDPGGPHTFGWTLVVLLDKSASFLTGIQEGMIMFA